VRIGIDGEVPCCTGDGREWYSLEVKLLTQRKHATWPGAMSVKIENIIKKKLETVSSLSHSTPVNTEERETALLAAVFRELSSSSLSRRGIVELATYAL
jgi:hypothetical protein